MKRLLIFALAGLLTGLAQGANAQSQDNITGVATITATAQVPGTVTKVGTPNTSGKGVYCTYSQTTEIGGTSTVIYVDGEDSVSGGWQQLGASSAAAISGAQQESLEVYPGIQTASLPTGMAGSGLKVPQLWRLRLVVTGGTSATGTANCDFLN